jgi:uncharacterized peroxidase-related enzyme
VVHHGAGLRRLLEAKKMDPADQNALIAALETDDLASPALAADRALLGYALKLTTSPQTITAADVDALRDAGLDDRAIHDACAVTAYFNFVNRMADGLGVELEGE